MCSSDLGLGGRAHAVRVGRFARGVRRKRTAPFGHHAQAAKAEYFQLGAGELGLRTARRIEDVPWAGIEVTGFFDDKIEVGDQLQELGKPLLGNTDRLEAYLREHELDYVYIALPLRAEKKIFKILRDCRGLGAQL